ncbi:MAG: hypothetical protein V7727_21030 [Sneathiella sp.]
MNDLYADTLKKLIGYFESLANHVEKPKLARLDDGFVYRFENPSIEAAILQKLVRVLTSIQAAELLNQQGFIQEQAAQQRMIDEFSEDVTFLAFAILFDDFTDRHREYLDAFFKEEFDQGSTAMDSSQKRTMIPRRKIRAYISKHEGNPNIVAEASRTFTNVLSGYLHGASPQIMELYYGNPPKFHLQGAKRSPYYKDHTEDLLNQYYRGIMAFTFAAKSFGNDELCSEINDYRKEFAKRWGKLEYLSPNV